MSENPSHLDGRVVIITGAGGGFGRLLAHGAAARGARVVASDIDEASLAETVATAPEGREVMAAPADVASRSAMAEVVTKAVERFGAVDVMINNAGTMPLAFFSDHAAAGDAWDRCIDINIKGVLNGITATYDQMISQGRCHVVNIASIYGNQPVIGAAVYGSTKAAVAFMSEALRQESRGAIKVTIVRPTGVPGTGLGGGIINPEAIGGIVGQNGPEYFETLGAIMGGEATPELTDEESISYAMLAPERLTDQVLHAIDQPWGVAISDITVRASGDHYVI